MDQLPEIEIGARICSRIKNNKFNDIPWDAVVSNDISKIFTKVKILARKYYPDLSEMEMLQKLDNYSNNDISETLQLIDQRIDHDGKKTDNS